MKYADKLFGLFQRLHTPERVSRNRHRACYGSSFGSTSWRNRLGPVPPWVKARSFDSWEPEEQRQLEFRPRKEETTTGWIPCRVG